MTNNQIIIGNNNTQIQNLNPQQKKVHRKSKSPKKPIKIEKPTAKESIKPPIPYLSELESEIADIFKSVYQKDRKPAISEVNAKTLESLKHKLHDLKASGNNINWLDMGCGDGRCLEVLDDIQDRGNIFYHGIDISHKFLDDAQIRTQNHGIRSKIETMNTAAMKFDSEFDLVSAVLFLHEVDPLCLPYVIRNMLRALKSDGTLIISDFEGPYEQEEGVVSWGAQYLKKFLSNIGGARMSIGFVPSGEFPKELGFYRCYVKKPYLDEERFQKFIERYGGFMKAKKEDSRKRREELRSQINKKVCEILKRPDIDTKNISDEEKALLRESMGKEYGIKALKIRLLTNEILFLDEKISEFERGERCGSI
jgi:SAM-dependent methyltransferase